MRLVLAVLACTILLVPAPATASCADDAGPAGSPVVFVGTMEEERRGFARFTVHEVRSGPDLAPEVWVLAGQEQSPWPLSLLSGVSSSIDAEFELGARYVVGATRSFSTNVCTVTEDDGRSDPDARAPVEGGSTGAEPPIGPLGQGLVVLALLTAAAAVVGALRRDVLPGRGRRPRSG